MSTVKKKIKLKTSKTPLNLLNELKSCIRDLYSVDPEKYIPKYTRLTCISELCIIHSEEECAQRLRLSSIRVIYEGYWLGVYVKGVVLPSTVLATKIIQERGLSAAIIITDHGVKAFLYGRDILPESVIKTYPSSRNIYAVIDHSDHEIIGFSKWDDSRKVYVNLYDLGLFLRILG